ncbi:MAG TPA: SOS response-associated peptidase [Chthonomonadaceae bacterium]|nr:SOS response-associated peptidase [Chthonomonadaceae bacterium]
MCGRYTMHHTTDQLAMRFGVQQVASAATERYNIAPTQPVPVVIETPETRVLDAYRWGLIPSWADDPAIGNKLINARAETLAEKPSFKSALVKRRCLIPSDGFYEWQKLADNSKQPMYIQLSDKDLFAFAGLWEEWKQPDGTPLRTCTIITVGPNEVMAPIHNRMPAILRPGDEALWLDPSQKSVPDLLSLLKTYPADRIEAIPVSKRVNTPTIDDPTLLSPL